MLGSSIILAEVSQDWGRFGLQPCGRADVGAFSIVVADAELSEAESILSCGRGADRAKAKTPPKLIHSQASTTMRQRAGPFSTVGRRAFELVTELRYQSAQASNWGNC